MSELPERFAERLAEKIERRRFIRRSSKVVFGTVAALAAGGGLEVLKAPKALANELLIGVRHLQGLGCK
jgi:hypothetical protein